MKNFSKKVTDIMPLAISWLLMCMTFTSRLALSIRSISLVLSLILILLVVKPKNILKVYCKNPMVQAATILYFCFIMGSFYGTSPLAEKIHVLRIYLPLLLMGFLFAFFETSFPNLEKRFTINRAKTFTSAFMYGAVLTAFLGCVNVLGIVDVVQLVHHHAITDPPEFPFGTFSFSISFAAYLAIQKMRHAESKSEYFRYLACFLFLSYFIFFINHQRTAYFLYIVVLLIYGYQQEKIKGGIKVLLWILFLSVGAYHSSATFQARAPLVVQEVKTYQQGNPISSTGLRLFFIKSSYELWKEKPLFGYGTGSFKETYLTIDGYNIGGQKNTPETALDQPHNDYAFIAVQLGLMGLIVFLLLLFRQTFYTFQLPLFEKQCAQAFILSFMVGALGTTQLFYATSLTDYFFFSALLYAPFFKK